jgi:hypothetical protein
MVSVKHMGTTAIKEWQETKKGWRKLMRLSVAADHSVKVKSITEVMPIINDISSILSRRGTTLAHDGTSTYAEPTTMGLINIANAIRPLLGDPLHHMLMDFGSGVGTTLWTLCNALGTKESVLNTHQTGFVWLQRIRRLC